MNRSSKQQANLAQPGDGSAPVGNDGERGDLEQHAKLAGSPAPAPVLDVDDANSCLSPQHGARSSSCGDCGSDAGEEDCGEDEEEFEDDEGVVPFSLYGTPSAFFTDAALFDAEEEASSGARSGSTTAPEGVVVSHSTGNFLSRLLDEKRRRESAHARKGGERRRSKRRGTRRSTGGGGTAASAGTDAPGVVSPGSAGSEEEAVEPFDFVEEHAGGIAVTPDAAADAAKEPGAKAEPGSRTSEASVQRPPAGEAAAAAQSSSSSLESSCDLGELAMHLHRERHRVLSRLSTMSPVQAGGVDGATGGESGGTGDGEKDEAAVKVGSAKTETTLSLLPEVDEIPSDAEQSSGASPGGSPVKQNSVGAAVPAPPPQQLTPPKEPHQEQKPVQPAQSPKASEKNAADGSRLRDGRPLQRLAGVASSGTAGGTGAMRRRSSSVPSKDAAAPAVPAAVWGENTRVTEVGFIPGCVTITIDRPNGVAGMASFVPVSMMRKAPGTRAVFEQLSQTEHCVASITLDALPRVIDAAELPVVISPAFVESMRLLSSAARAEALERRRRAVKGTASESLSLLEVNLIPSPTYSVLVPVASQRSAGATSSSSSGGGSGGPGHDGGARSTARLATTVLAEAQRALQRSFASAATHHFRQLGTATIHAMAELGLVTPDLADAAALHGNDAGGPSLAAAARGSAPPLAPAPPPPSSQPRARGSPQATSLDPHPQPPPPRRTAATAAAPAAAPEPEEESLPSRPNDSAPMQASPPRVAPVQPHGRSNQLRAGIAAKGGGGGGGNASGDA